MSHPRRNRIRIGALALALASAALLLPDRTPGAEPPEPPLEGLHSVVEGYAHAIETNNRELALWYVHPGSPHRSQIDAALREQLASYLERARTSNLEQIRGADARVSARVDQEIVRVAGMKFMRQTRRSIYHFRELEGSWRIWEIDEAGARGDDRGAALPRGF